MRLALVVFSATALSSTAFAAAPAAPAVAAKPPSAATAASTAVSGDAVRGEKRFKAVCGACHTIDPAKKSIGPHLKGVIGRKAGTVAGFNYSVAMKNSGIVWDAKILDPYLARPGAVVAGTKMVNILANPKDRADIIAYLATVK
jgi:cytochrome c2